MKNIKQDFLILKRKINGKQLVYLDSAASSQKPKQVIGAIKKYYEKHNANIHRGIHSLSEEASELYEKAREKVAGFIGAGKDELVFVSNTTEGINLVSWAWGEKQLKRGDEILISIGEHHSNWLPWKRLEAKGVRVRLLKVDEEGRLKMKDVEKKLSKKTRLVAVSHMSNVTGVVNPVKRVCQMAKRVGARVMVDGAQSVPHMGVKVKDLGCDWLAFSGHKMLGPMGIGGLYISKEVEKEMGVFMTGGGMVVEVHKDDEEWVKGIERFEAGTPNVVGAVGLGAAVEYLETLGMDKVWQDEQKLTSYFLTLLKTKDLKLKIVGPGNMEDRGGVISFVMKGVHAHDVAQVLDSEGIAVRSGFHCAQPLHEYLGVAATVRVSFYVYNTREDVDRLVKGLERVRQVFR